jgi:hypothetical protein
MVDSNVLTPINDNDLTATAVTDQDSIMCYHLPASIMKDGKEVHGGPDINARDAKFCHAIYPPPFTGYRTVADLNFEEVTRRISWTCASVSIMQSTSQLVAWLIDHGSMAE